MRLIDLITPAAPPLCVACSAWAGQAEPLCAACRRLLRWLGPEPVVVGSGRSALGVWAPLAYDGPARGVVRALKFRGAVRVAAAMAAPMHAAAPPGWLDGVDWLVPAPLHPARRRSRGFNQAERLAHALAERGGGRTRVCDCLERAGPGTTQMGRGRTQRLSGIAGAVRLRSPPPAGGRVLLVDDVVTTGATLAACARALRTGGFAQDIDGIAYARTPGR